MIAEGTYQSLPCITIRDMLDLLYISRLQRCITIRDMLDLLYISRPLRCITNRDLPN